MPFLVIDDRFGSPIHVFLDDNPWGSADYPGLVVRSVRLATIGPIGRGGAFGPAIGRHPEQADAFQEFASDRAVAAAGYVLVEPRYVGPSWERYLSAFRPGGSAAARGGSTGSDPHSVRGGMSDAAVPGG